MVDLCRRASGRFDFMTDGDEPGDEPPADRSGRSGNKHAHRLVPFRGRVSVSINDGFAVALPANPVVNPRELSSLIHI
jgi:hypothetical protein